MTGVLRSALLATLVGGGACQATRPVTPDAGTPAGPTKVVHDPANPPIDCPLRAQGIDPTHLKPFEDTSRYIAFLERADREVWQKPDAVVSALGLTGKEVVFDVGAGSGYFAFRFARALPGGRVVAADTEPEMLQYVFHTAMGRGFRNVGAKLIKPDDPGVTADTDLVFICDVLHHVNERATWLAKIVDAMRPGSRLALIEFREGKLPEGPPESMKIPRAGLLELATNAGLVLETEHADLLPYQVFLVFRKPLPNR